MRAFKIVFLFLVFIACKNKEEASPVSMKDDVTVLADDTFNGRETGTTGEREAAAYISKRFKELGLEPKGYTGDYYQSFVFRPSANPHEEVEFTGLKSDSTTTGVNVIGFIDNDAATTVVIGAHYDHLGMGGEGSLYREGKAIHNGADDNASGVAVLLDLAKRLQNTKSQQNYLFIAFSGEEMGLLGSNYFVKNPTIDISTVSYMVNMDMVGRLNAEKTVAVHGVGTSPIFKQTLFSNKGDLTIAEHESGIGPSDHTSFYLADIPVLHFFTGQHEDYHKPSDDPEKLNYEGMEAVANLIFGVIADLDPKGKLEFRKTKNESEAVPDFKVTLGVVPDYLFTGKGMRIDGVSEDRPAQKAGLQKGDVVVKMGTHPVTDMMSYMKTLSKFEKGEKAMVTVEREGVPMEVEVEF
ncbi:M20/M25/M40 family metallo-hydrolase [Altibacter sp.]|uniref:M20/M25/M40 family metallo-hydrolase n=1 Tax=Altibacter sp. TaxID=2024823 RepID=UPI0025895B79|nr:M20/M25/M40 family metallo-hydrolase [Altibacter sp.]MCW8980886.1 M20/M25/M40 family metallo-hydrolase [Altibacter sp.]MCW9038568.1 M20/M25/M40 family metallo-hydrolase [Altibacter sp.]